MPNSRWNLAAAALLAAATLAVTPALMGAASVASRSVSSADVVGRAVSSHGQRAAIRYWTQARMRHATSLDVVSRPGSPQTRSVTPAQAGAPESVAPSAPSGSTASRTHVGSGTTVAALSSSYPYPFTRSAVSPVSKYTTYPWSVNGKLFFTQNGGNYVCSGTAVVSANRNEVWTAGHCVSNGAGVFDSFAEFVPAYNGASRHPAPKGVFVANHFSTTTRWHRNGDLRRDLGAIRVNANASGISLGRAVGEAGFAWNQQRRQSFVDFGYPQELPFHGKAMITCRAATATADIRVGGAGPAPMGIGCDMTGGSSGGSWQTGWNGLAGRAGYINGHNDYHYTSRPRAMYSPYFDTLANRVRCLLEPSGSHGC
jgi:V8-like Glu-specific endopeptidase